MGNFMGDLNEGPERLQKSAKSVFDSTKSNSNNSKKSIPTVGSKSSKYGLGGISSNIMNL
jgi:hypothetical protein